MMSDLRPTLVFDDQTLRPSPRSVLACAILACSAAFFPMMTRTISTMATVLGIKWQ